MIHQTLCGELVTSGSDRALAADRDFLTLWQDADPLPTDAITSRFHHLCRTERNDSMTMSAPAPE
jgi:hypothetical protein